MAPFCSFVVCVFGYIKLLLYCPGPVCRLYFIWDILARLFPSTQIDQKKGKRILFLFLLKKQTKGIDCVYILSVYTIYYVYYVLYSTTTRDISGRPGYIIRCRIDVISPLGYRPPKNNRVYFKLDDGRREENRLQNDCDVDVNIIRIYVNVSGNNKFSFWFDYFVLIFFFFWGGDIIFEMLNELESYQQRRDAMLFLRIVLLSYIVADPCSVFQIWLVNINLFYAFDKFLFFIWNIRNYFSVIRRFSVYHYCHRRLL
jgi:hypothetical protein